MVANFGRVVTVTVYLQGGVNALNGIEATGPQCWQIRRSDNPVRQPDKIVRPTRLASARSFTWFIDLPIGRAQKAVLRDVIRLQFHFEVLIQTLSEPRNALTL